VTTIKTLLKLLLIWLTNTLVISLGNLLYPFNLVLGTYNRTTVQAALYAGLALTIVCYVGKKLYPALKIKLKGKVAMFGYYWAVNSVALWLIAKFPTMFGFGISAFYWAIFLGLFTNLGQWVVRQLLKRAKYVK